MGHSYAGFLISYAAAKDPAVKALVYVAAYIPEKGETPLGLTGKYPGSKLTAGNIITRAEPGGTDIYINPADFAKVFAGGLSKVQVEIDAAAQDPITLAALSDPATVNTPSATPKWEIVALHDNAIPPKAEYFMAHRAHARVVTANSSHDIPQVAPQVVDNVIIQAAKSAG